MKPLITTHGLITECWKARSDLKYSCLTIPPLQTVITSWLYSKLGKSQPHTHVGCNKVRWGLWSLVTWQWVVKINTEKDTTSESTGICFMSISFTSKNSEQEPRWKSCCLGGYTRSGLSQPAGALSLSMPSWPKGTGSQSPYHPEMESRKWLKTEISHSDSTD